MNFAALYAKLNIKLGDNDNFAFTQEEKEEILTESIEDEYVVKSVWDDSLVFATDTWRYAVPSGVTTIKDIYIQVDSTQDPEAITLPWDVVEGYIQFKGGSSIIPDGSTLFIRGNHKYTVDDTIAETRLQQYILSNAQILAMDEIGIKKILKFVKNDTSVSEILAVKNALERKVAKYKSSIPKEFQAG